MWHGYAESGKEEFSNSYFSIFLYFFKEKSRRREIEAQNIDLKRRLEASEGERAALASELNAKLEKNDDELQRLRAELDGLKKLMSDDLQVAIDSIATRGPFINIDVSLTCH